MEDSNSEPTESPQVKIPAGWKRPASQAFDGFGQYMSVKVNKLEQQYHASTAISSSIFRAVAVYVTGHTQPSLSTLRSLVVQNGGKFCQYYTLAEVTHVIASNLSASKAKGFKNVKVVLPAWIVDSVDKGELLDWQDYALDPNSLLIAPDRLAATVGAESSASPQRAGPLNSTDPKFLSTFYASSRLHYLSTWKSEMKQYSFRQLPTPDDVSKRVIMHVDFDCFFASVSLRDRPELVGKPVGVSHGQGQGGLRSSDVASCSYEARAMGVSNGMSVGKALEKCPSLILLPYEFEKYKEATDVLYQVLRGFADALEAVSCDEAYLEVCGARVDPALVSNCNTRIEDSSKRRQEPKSAIDLALEVRRAILDSVNLSVSIGIGSSPLLAKLATKFAKPGGVFHLNGDVAITQKLDSLKIDGLPGIGYSLKSKIFTDLQRLGHIDSEDEVTCGVVRRVYLNLKDLQALLGQKIGIQLWKHVRGQDDRVISENCADLAERKSVSTEVSWGIRFENRVQVDEFLAQFSAELMTRLKSAESQGCIAPKKATVNISFRDVDAPMEPTYKYLGHGRCERVSRSTRLPQDQPLSQESLLSAVLPVFWKTCAEFQEKRYSNSPEKAVLIIRDLRGIGFQISDFASNSSPQAKKQQVSKRRKGLPITLTQMWRGDSPIKVNKINKIVKMQRPAKPICFAREAPPLFDLQTASLDEILEYAMKLVETLHYDQLNEVIRHLEQSENGSEALLIIWDTIREQLTF